MGGESQAPHLDIGGFLRSHLVIRAADPCDGPQFRAHLAVAVAGGRVCCGAAGGPLWKGIPGRGKAVGRLRNRSSQNAEGPESGFIQHIYSAHYTSVLGARCPPVRDRDSLGVW